MNKKEKQASIFTAGELAALEAAALEGRVSAAAQDARLDAEQREILRIISMHRGAQNAIPATSIIGQLGLEDDFAGHARRKIKGAVEFLTTQLRVPIGGSRQKPFGYFLIVSASDIDAAIGPLWAEVYALLRRLSALTSREDTARLFNRALNKLASEEAA